MALKYHYQAGIPALIQFITMVLLNILNGVYSSVTTCTNSSGNCISNLALSLAYLIVLTIWFAFLAILAWTAQDRRSQRLAKFLIAAEALTGLVALFDALHFPNALGLITSAIDLLLAAWVILLAYRLARSKGRIVTQRGRSRQRRTT